ncbi:type II secretion system protein GspK [Pseudomonas sp. TNT2022 ID1044]|uniref:general secretion pathway protein GspK n=1 Tax=Pseudomonas sp. TNT2022 ID1044 TaxID=2942636 RepID=UPI00236007BC|nr:type II secretion system protein GspK [Pseudomonas sp. TNT2022 ID1044]MDD0995699.1 type II secretion system protein GspK [Pseudomonas sp. TNT2022 ID1044]
MRKGQRGVALISVLLVMSLALVIIGGVLRSHRLLLQSAGQQLQQLHLRQLGMAGETLGLSLLKAQQKVSDRVPDQLPVFDIDDAQVSLDIEDLAGRFNLNAVLIQGQIDQVTLKRWARLLALLELPDWQLEQVGALRDLSQLRLLPDVVGEQLRRLEPWVALLPADASLNINSAPALILRTLESVETAEADALLRQRSTAPWPSVQAFTQDPLLSGKGLSSHGLGIDSRWYRITVQVTQGQSRLRLATDVERDPRTRQLKILQRRVLPSNSNEIAR